MTGPIHEFAERTEREFTRLAIALEESHATIVEQANEIKRLTAARAEGDGADIDHLLALIDQALATVGPTITELRAIRTTMTRTTGS